MLGTIGYIKGLTMASSAIGENYTDATFKPGESLPESNPTEVPLPKEYQKLTYVATRTGKQCYKPSFRFIPTLTRKYVIDFLYTGRATSYVLGCANATASCAINGKTGTLRIGRGYDIGKSYANNNDRHVISLDLLNKVYTIDDTSYDIAENNIDLPGSLIMFIGASNNRNSTLDGVGNYRFYRVQAYDNNKLIVDYVPAKKLATNEIGLYDKVNGNFLLHSGGGSVDYAE